MIKHYLDIFTVEEINKIIKLGDSLVFEKAKIGVGDKPKVRQSEISWIHPPSMAQWMINKIVKIFEQGPLYKAIQDLQYTVYSKGGHYDWHTDLLKHKVFAERVNVAVLQLSNVSDYTGGILEIDDGQKIVSVKKKKGMITSFSIGMRHRVTPVKSGIRKTLVMWAVNDE